MSYKEFCLVLVIPFLIITSCSDNEPVVSPKNYDIGINEMEFSSSSIAGAVFEVDIILPPEYDSAQPDQYPVLIYLHGSLGNSKDDLSPFLKSASEELIASETIDPLIIVVPTINYDGPNDSFGNRHAYFNSEYYGNYQDVITVDLVSWLRENNFAALNNKGLFDRENMAIGGFSMGGDGALRIALSKPEIFSSVSAHGAAPSLARPLIEGGIAPAILSESPMDEGTFIFSPNNGFFSNTIFGISAAWNNLKDGEIQFLLNTDGSINEEVYNEWVRNADCLTLIKSHNWNNQQQISMLPKIFLEIGSEDAFKGFNDFFAGVEIAQEGLENLVTYFVSEGKQHGFDDERAKEALISIDSSF